VEKHNMAKEHWISIFTGSSSRSKRDDKPTTKKGPKKRPSGVKKPKATGSKTGGGPLDNGAGSTPAELFTKSVQLPKLIDLLDVTVTQPPPAGASEGVDLDPEFSTLREGFRQYQDGSGSEPRDDLRFSQLLKSFEQLERSRTNEKKHHQEIETRLKGELQVSRERFIIFEREMQRAMQSEVEKNLRIAFDQLQAAKLAEERSQVQIKTLKLELFQVRNEVQTVTERLRSEKEQKEQLSREVVVYDIDLRNLEREYAEDFSKFRCIFLETKAEWRSEIDAERRRGDLLLADNKKLKNELECKEKTAKAELENERLRYQELERSIRIPQGPSALEKKKQELQAKVGAPVAVRHIGKWGGLTDGDLDKLTPAMLAQMKTITEQFAKLHPVLKIEYILNNNLYKQYEDTRSMFKKLGRGTKEVLVFHGTEVKNINPFPSAFSF
jgi:hypothetical protein